MKQVARQGEGMFRVLANERGRLLEIPILLALICISVAIGAGQYAKHGWPGFFLGTAIVFFGVIIAFAALIGIVSGVARVAEALSKHGWFLSLRTLFKWILLFVFFSFWGTIFSLGVGALFGFDLTGKDLAWYLDLIPPAIGAVWVMVRRYLEEVFWPAFWRFSGLLVLGAVAVFVGMLVGQGFFKDPSTLMRFLQVLFFVPLVLYVLIRLIGRKKAPGDEPSQPEP
jgi:hypothetical protein